MPPEGRGRGVSEAGRRGGPADPPSRPLHRGGAAAAKMKGEVKQSAAAKKKNDAGVRRTSFLIRVQLCEERIRMTLTDHDTRVGVVLDLLRARCPGYRIDALSTFDGCEMHENDKITDLCDYGECVVVTSGRTAAARYVCCWRRAASECLCAFRSRAHTRSLCML